jgi:hypothetical protein
VFEKQLESKFLKIFNCKKVTFDQPGQSQEQECLFVEIEIAKNIVKDGQVISKISGSASMFGNNDKLTFGYFSKRIAKSDPDDTKSLFFYDIESNTKRFQNIVQRGFSFIYFFNSQFDPETGSIDSVTFTTEEN